MRFVKQANASASGNSASDIYTPEDSIALTRLMYDIRMSWNMIFDGEIQA